MFILEVFESLVTFTNKFLSFKLHGKQGEIAAFFFSGDYGTCPVTGLLVNCTLLRLRNGVHVSDDLLVSNFHLYHAGM